MIRRRVLLAAAAAITIGLPTAPAAADVGAPKAPGGVALTWAPTYMSSQHSYTEAEAVALARQFDLIAAMPVAFKGEVGAMRAANPDLTVDRKSTRLNSSHANISYAVFCLEKQKARARTAV